VPCLTITSADSVVHGSFLAAEFIFLFFLNGNKQRHTFHLNMVGMYSKVFAAIQFSKRPWASS
jgi:hypothetical protein